MQFGPRFCQNKAPKVTSSDMSPAEWPANAELEWCPPGHGDLYPAMLGTGAKRLGSLGLEDLKKWMKLVVLQNMFFWC